MPLDNGAAGIDVRVTGEQVGDEHVSGVRSAAVGGDPAPQCDPRARELTRRTWVNSREMTQTRTFNVALT